MKHILEAQLLNGYRSKKPAGFYSFIKGHTGVDLQYNYEELPCPITGKVVAITSQVEMGRCIYVEDSLTKFIFVFSHLSSIKCFVGKKINRNDIIAITGNTGTKSTKAHLHFEMITGHPINKIDWVMSRNLGGFKGFNTDPIVFLKDRYKTYELNNAGESKLPKPPTWIH